MIKRSTPLKLQILFFIISVLFINSKSISQTTSLSEGFDDGVPGDWITINHSANNGGAGLWDKGNARQFFAYSGDSASYVEADIRSIGHSGKGTISNWLITPELNISNGGAISFYTRTTLGSTYPDRLEVRLSTNGISTNVGSTPTDVGDFTTVLVTINPNLDVDGYPDTGWTKYTAIIPAGSSAGRVAFRYYVTNGGSGGNNSNYIGVDEFSYESALPVTLFNFRGQIVNNKAVLTWSTANELNNKGFEIETSHDNKTFSSLGFVAGNGSAPGTHNYSFTDAKLLSGSTYYRLKQIDMDGNSRYSPVVKLDFKTFAWSIFGNPSVNNTWIQLQTETQSNVAVQIVSINGQLLQTISKGNIAAGTYTIPLNLNNASHGIYVVRLIVDKDSYTKKLMK